ncbi:MAG: type II CAAX endopeptidase family protein [Gemmatimonadaceae bacterium]
MNLPTGSSAAAPPQRGLAGVWRVSIFLGVALLSVTGLQLSATALWRVGAIGLPSMTWSVTSLSLGLLVAHAVVIRRYHSGDWAYVGLDRAAAESATLLHAMALGALAIGVPSLLLLGAGELSYESAGVSNVGLTTSPWALLAVLVPAALWEELALRGYVLSVLRERYGARVALLVTSVLFGALHLQNAGSTALSTVAVVLAGVFLGLVRLSTGSLYAAWIAHLAWNLTMSFVLRTPVSGIDLSVGGYRIVDSGPDWLTGGAWGPEGGLAAMLGMCAGSWYLVRRSRREEFTT